MIKNFIFWLKASFEDNKGQASYRRLTALVFTLLICYMVLSEYIQTGLQLNAFYALLISDLLLIGIITAQNVVTIIKGYDSNLPKKELENLNVD